MTVETRTYAAVNEIASRTVGGINKAFKYNGAGHLIDDAEKLYMYDAFGRLRYVHASTNGTRGTLLEESRYSGLSHRIRSHSDQDFDNDTDANDPWTDMVYDDSWRIVATFRSGDAANRPRERFVYYCGGMYGRGSSSYIDDIVLRERSDATPPGAGCHDHDLLGGRDRAGVNATRGDVSGYEAEHDHPLRAADDRGTAVRDRATRRET